MEEQIALFDITEEFRITDEMEDGKLYQLTKDASVTVRSLQSKTYLKGLSKIQQDNPEIGNLEMLCRSLAKYGIVDICNVTIGGEKVENTYESKLKALMYDSDEENQGPFLFFISQKASIKNFEGAGKSLKAKL